MTQTMTQTMIHTTVTPPLALYSNSRAALDWVFDTTAPRDLWHPIPIEDIRSIVCFIFNWTKSDISRRSVFSWYNTTSDQFITHDAKVLQMPPFIDGHIRVPVTPELNGPNRAAAFRALIRQIDRKPAVDYNYLLDKVYNYAQPQETWRRRTLADIRADLALPPSARVDLRLTLQAREHTPIRYSHAKSKTFYLTPPFRWSDENIVAYYNKSAAIAQEVRDALRPANTNFNFGK